MAFTGNYTCNVFKSGLLTGVYNFSADTFKMALYNNSASLNADTAAYSTTLLGEVTPTGSYVAGGQVLTGVALGFNNGTAYLSFNNPSWTGAFTARGALIYNVTASDAAVCVLDFGNDKTSVNTFTVQFPFASSTSAIIRIA
jgi:hypothetical protein